MSNRAVLGWRAWVIGLLILISASVIYGVALVKQNLDEAVEISESNNTFLANFSDYMRCLVVTDEIKYEELGKAAYFDMCDTLLFRGTGLKP